MNFLKSFAEMKLAGVPQFNRNISNRKRGINKQFFRHSDAKHVKIFLWLHSCNLIENLAESTFGEVNYF